MKKLIALISLLLLPALVYAQGGVLITPPGAATVTASSTTTFTNKTIDGEGTGNVITLPFKLYIPAAGGTAAAPASVWNLPATNPAVAVVTAGTNTLQGTLDFADGANTLSAQTDFWLPSDWTGAIDAKILWFSSTTSGDVKFSLATICVADAETNDPAFNTASTVTDTTKGSANQLNVASITGVTATGCAAGELMHIKLSRDPTDGADTLGGTARVIAVELTYRRAI